MKKITQVNSNNIKTIKLETLLKKELKSKSFTEHYNEEITRLELSSKIKKIRIAKKMTQESFAKKANMPQSVIARVESGKHTISLSTLDKLAHALGKKIAIV